MDKKLHKSVLITGASASGKTTLHCCLTIHFKLLPYPVHTTRALRLGEVEGIDINHVSHESYLENFKKGFYLESSPEAAFFGGAYYGSPIQWVTKTRSGNYNCFVCPTVVVARLIKKCLGNKVFWIHLIASERIRKERISQRNPKMRPENTSVRLKRGSSKIDITGHDYCIDTSFLSAKDIFERAAKYIHQNDDLTNLSHICVAS